MSSTLRGRITGSSQPEVLRRQMASAGLRHGETATVNIRNVHADLVPGILGPRKAQIRFCHIPQLEVLSTDGRGDSQELPFEVTLTGLRFPGAGVYDLENVEIHSNGSMRVRRTQATVIRRHEVAALTHG